MGLIGINKKRTFLGSYQRKIKSIASVVFSLNPKLHEN